MARVDVAMQRAALRAYGKLLAAAASDAGLASPVPTCPGWMVRDLMRHVGLVHRWATGYVANRRREFWAVSDDEVVGAWPDDDGLVPWFSDGHAALVAALESAPDDLDCWTFLPAPTPLAMWTRRQAHETAIHRFDAEAAAGGAPSYPAAFAADGIDELLTCFVPRPKTDLRADPPRTLRVIPDDADGDWLVRIGPEGAETSTGGSGDDADCEVRGRASDLYLTLWNRHDGTGLTVEGDASVLELFHDRVDIRWS